MSGEAQTAEELYRTLDPRELVAVVSSCSLGLEDVRQEAWLLCLAVASGQSAYRSTLGSVRQYVMGRLWGLTLRWQVPLRFGQGEDPEDGEVYAPGDAPWERALVERSPYAADPEAADPLHVLEVREEEEAYRAALALALARWVGTRRLTEGDRTFLELILGGAPIDQIAALYGLTPRAVRYRCERLEQKIREARCADADLAADSERRAEPADGDDAPAGAATGMDP
ncbi:MAG: hypothetical protein ACYDB8_07060 [Acidiferrobacterales bacterium]